MLLLAYIPLQRSILFELFFSHCVGIFSFAYLNLKYMLADCPFIHFVLQCH